MSYPIINKILLNNFKCHKYFEEDFGVITLLSGGNAAGKSSIIQSILMHDVSWESNHIGKIQTYNVHGNNLGVPISIISQNNDEEILRIGIEINKEMRMIELKASDSDELSFDINNTEQIRLIKESDELYKYNLFYINAERFGPRLMNDIEYDGNLYVGSHGENTIYIISLVDQKEKVNSMLRIPKELNISEISRFSANCEAWLDFIIPGTKLKTYSDTEMGVSSIRYNNFGDTFYSPTATGFGITYVLPIIVQALIASMLKGSILMVENPEAHLHPYSQSMMGRFLGFISSTGTQVIVETHSEHLINGCRLQLAKLKKCDLARVLFFNKEVDGYRHQCMELSENGELAEWPDGFFDQTRKDLKELLEIKLCRK